MRSHQNYENGSRHFTNYVGGGSDHEGLRAVAWIVIIIVIALVVLWANYTLGVSIDALIGGF